MKLKLCLLLLFLPLSACRQPSALTDTNIGVAVTVAPHAYLVDRISGIHRQCEILVPAGQEPEEYQVTPQQIAALSHTRLFFCTGLPAEKQLLPKLQSINQFLRIIDLRTSNTKPDDPHIWFAPTLLKQQAETILKELQHLDSTHAAEYQENYSKLIADIETLRTALETQLAPFKGQPVFVFHPTYGYFCSEFNLRQVAVELEGHSPSPKEIAGLITEAKKNNCRVIFIQPEFNSAPAMSVAEAVKGTVKIHSALEYDVLKSMKQFGEDIVNVSH